MSNCHHHWLRLPIVDLAVMYRCQECETALLFSWLAAPGGTLDDLDRAFEAKYGGTVVGSRRANGPGPAGTINPNYEVVRPQDGRPNP